MVEIVVPGLQPENIHQLTPKVKLGRNGRRHNENPLVTAVSHRLDLQLPAGMPADQQMDLLRGRNQGQVYVYEQDQAHPGAATLKEGIKESRDGTFKISTRDALRRGAQRRYSFVAVDFLGTDVPQYQPPERILLPQVQGTEKVPSA